jgi:hypothetical protein
MLEKSFTPPKVRDGSDGMKAASFIQASVVVSNRFPVEII